MIGFAAALILGLLLAPFAIADRPINGLDLLVVVLLIAGLAGLRAIRKKTHS
ncbi:MAG: hypothetical protein J0H96_05870 [Microbacterium ginsengisoli]|nr:hypothetical protein [Microbacterium ginsengisoli]